MQIGDVYVSKRESVRYVIKSDWREDAFDIIVDVLSIRDNGEERLVKGVSVSLLRSVATLEPKNAKEFNRVCHKK